MKVNIVTVKSGWILQKIAERTAFSGNNLGHEFKISETADYSADVNYYIDLQNVQPKHKTKCDVAYLTHADQNSMLWLNALMGATGGWNLKGIVSMNKRYTDMLSSIGYPAKKIITLTPGQVVDKFKFKKTKIGIVSRGGYPGYGHNFLIDFFNKYNWQNEFSFYFLGSNWEEVIDIAKLNKYTIKYYPNENYNFYNKFYEMIDYLLIPGLWTAGPMCMQEALACGIPIIASNVGFVNYEFKADYVFKPGILDELNQILISIDNPKKNRRAQVEHLNWENYTSQLIEFFNTLLVV